MAESTLFILVAMTVAAFNIAKATDATGRDIEPVREFGPGIIRYDQSDHITLINLR